MSDDVAGLIERLQNVKEWFWCDEGWGGRKSERPRFVGDPAPHEAATALAALQRRAEEDAAIMSLSAGQVSEMATRAVAAEARVAKLEAALLRIEVMADQQHEISIYVTARAALAGGSSDA